MFMSHLRHTIGLKSPGDCIASIVTRSMLLEYGQKPMTALSFTGRTPSSIPTQNWIVRSLVPRSEWGSIDIA